MKHPKLLYLLLLPISIVIFNVVINPFDQWNIPRFTDLNEKITEIPRDLMIKPYQIRHESYDTIILGSSVVAAAYSPKHPAFMNKHVYNFGLSGTGPHVQYLALNHALKYNDIKFVIISLDFFAFNAYWKLNQPNEELKRILDTQFYPSDKDCPRCVMLELDDILYNTLGWRGINASLRTLIRQNRDTTYMDKSGFWQHYGYDEEHYAREYNRAERIFVTENLFPPPHKTFSFIDPETNYSAFDDLQKIIALLQQRNIQVKIVISPMPARSLLSLYQLGLWPMYQTWLKTIVDINEMAAQKMQTQPYEIWSMHTVHDSARSDKVEDQREFFYDAFHSTAKTGDMVLNEVFMDCSVVVCWPGNLVTKENITTHLVALEQKLLDYQSSKNSQISSVTKNIEKTARYRADTQQVNFPDN